MAIADGFRQILMGTALTRADHDAFAVHRRQVEARLRSALDVVKFETIGSYARGSAIRQVSDLDLLVVLRATEWRWGESVKSSGTVLGSVRQQLQSRFPSTAIGRDGQAVVVPFSDGRSLDVVPAGWLKAQADGWPLYIIAGDGGRWIQTAPDSHCRLINDSDIRTGGKLKHVARVFKYWKYRRGEPIPISSFHVELLLAADGRCGVGMSYAECFASLLLLLEHRECRAIQDPLRISGLVPACCSEAKRAAAMRSVAASAVRAGAAVRAEQVGNVAEAHRLWSIVFNGGFPND
jgi:predicted nucleotidyltransferase